MLLKLVYVCNNKMLGIRTVLTYIIDDFGVPQGTLVGSRLFVLCINYIVKCVKVSKICIFAYDTMLYVSKTNISFRLTETWKTFIDGCVITVMLQHKKN